MLTTLITILVTLALAAGGAGATVYAAQDSTPDDVLYPVKTWVEEVQLRTTNKGTEQQLQLILRFAEQRFEELAKMEAKGGQEIDPIANRYTTQMMNAFGLAAELEGEELDAALMKIAESLAKQTQLLSQLGNFTDANQFMEMVSYFDEMVEQGKKDPEAFKHQVAERAGNMDSEKGPYGPFDGKDSEDVVEPGFGPGPGQVEEPAGEGPQEPAGEPGGNPEPSGAQTGGSDSSQKP